jgi:hypothetical protein
MMHDRIRIRSVSGWESLSSVSRPAETNGGAVMQRSGRNPPTGPRSRSDTAMNKRRTCTTYKHALMSQTGRALRRNREASRPEARRGPKAQHYPKAQHGPKARCPRKARHRSRTISIHCRLKPPRSLQESLPRSPQFAETGQRVRSSVK